MQVPCNEAPKPLFALGKMLYGIAMVYVKCCVHNERAFSEEHKLKIKQVITGIAALACVSTAAHAQSAGFWKSDQFATSETNLFGSYLAPELLKQAEAPSTFARLPSAKKGKMTDCDVVS